MHYSTLTNYFIPNITAILGKNLTAGCEIKDYEAEKMSKNARLITQF